jgi:cytochrome bd-I ubiquinol oxidase subunit X
MWYFSWTLGVGFAVLLAILNAMWGENEEGRATGGQPDRGDGRK